jgi:broad specificity phosphatase PhoE
VILLARHGETDANVEPIRFQGRTDTPLNERGRAQAHELAALVAREHKVAALYSSDLARARETAAIVGAAIGLEVCVDARFAESYRGDWEGRYFHDVEKADPKRYRDFRHAGTSFRFPGGESLAEHMERVVEGLVDITQTGPLPALVVCHGGTIRVALCHTNKRGLYAFWDYEVPNASVVAL